MLSKKVAGRVVGCGLLMSAAFATRPAAASGYLTARFGSDHGNPVAASPYAIYFNPAALGGMTGTQVVGDLSVGVRYATYDRPREALSPAQANPNDPNYVNANTGKARLLNVVPLPFLGGATDFGGSKNWRAGLGVYVPFGGLAKWDDRSNWAGFSQSPGAVDGPQRWHNISGVILAIYTTAAVAYRVPQWNLTFGANVSAIRHQVDTVRARNIEGSDDVRTPSGLKEGRSLLDASGTNFSAALGVMWEPTDRLKIGLSYTSQPGFGETKMTGNLTQQFGTVAQEATATRINFWQTYPDVVRLGFAYKLDPKLELRVDAEYVRWSLFKRQCVTNEGFKCEVTDDTGAQTSADARVILNIPRKWKDAIGIRAGLGYFATDALEIFGSASLTTSAVPKETIDVSTIDSTRVYGTLGARYAITENFALAGSYNLIYFLPVDTKGRSEHYRYPAPSKSPSADGVYESIIHFFNVNGTLSF
jgi:long-chain fatty acid transport protein